MQTSGSQSSFFIRTMHPSRQTTCELPKQSLIVDPPKIQIVNYVAQRISVISLTIQNESKIPKKFTITQPSKSFFLVKCAEKEIKGKQSVEIFIWFNPQKEKVIIEDQLVINVKGDSTQIFVPITCYPKTTLGRSDSRKILSSRDNEDPSIDRAFIRPSMRSKMNLRPSVIFKIEEQAKKQKQLNFGSMLFTEFQQRYRQISEYVRQKYVKIQVYLGAKKLTNKKCQEIKTYKVMVVQQQRQKLFKQIMSRFNVCYASEGPIANSDVQCALTWNLKRNVPSITFNLGVLKIKQQAKKYIISLRFEKIRKTLKIYDDYRKKIESQQRKLKIEDYIDYLDCRLKQNNFNTDYQFQFDKISIRPSALPVQAQFRSLQGSFQVSQRVGFDNWIPMNTLKSGFQQIYSQKQIEFPTLFYHHPTLLKDIRKGNYQQMNYKDGNQTTIDEIENLLQTIDLDQQTESTEEDNSRLLNKWKMQDKIYYKTEIDDHPYVQEQKYFMHLGPLNPCRWNQKSLASIDIFGLIKTDF